VCYRSEQVLLVCFFEIQKRRKHDTNKGIKAGSIKGTFHNCTSREDSSSYVTEKKEEEEEDLTAYRAYKNQIPSKLTDI
jgi:hypothetical protein